MSKARKTAIILVAILGGLLFISLVIMTLFVIKSIDNVEDSINYKLFGTSSSGLDVNEEALLRLKNKYGEEFEYAQPWGNSMSGTRQFLAKCNSLDELVLVQIENYKTENKVFKDNYIAVRYKQNVINFLQEKANETFGEANVFYEVTRDGLPETLGADATFEEYFKVADILFRLEVNESNYNSTEQIKKFANAVYDKVPLGKLTGSIMVMPEAEYGIYDAGDLGSKYKYNFQIYAPTDDNGVSVKQYSRDESGKLITQEI